MRSPFSPLSLSRYLWFAHRWPVGRFPRSPASLLPAAMASTAPVLLFLAGSFPSLSFYLTSKYVRALQWESFFLWSPRMATGHSLCVFYYNNLSHHNFLGSCLFHYLNHNYSVLHFLRTIFTCCSLIFLSNFCRKYGSL